MIMGYRSVKPFTISLRNRLALTYTLFIAAALGILAIAINLFTRMTFNTLIKENISVKSREIVRAVSGLYDPMTRYFDIPAVEAIGMYFVHEGYIVSVEDKQGDAVWNARACDMGQCRSVINDITSRMKKQFRVNGGMQKQRYPMRYRGMKTGTVVIESYGPYFYSGTETEFLSSINRLLTIAGIIFAILGAVVSTAISGAIARPVNKAGEAALMIADAHTAGGTGGAGGAGGTGGAGGGMRRRLPIRIPEDYKTRELASLSRSINRLASELEDAERRQKQLTADIAHELRTPLTCLQGNIEAMIDGVYKADSEHLASCHEEITRLSALVRDLNTLTGLEWETLPLCKTDFDLAKLLRTTAEQFQSAAAEKGIALRLDLHEAPINADYDRLKQVFINLLSNALKYTEAGSVTVSIKKFFGGEASPLPTAPQAGLPAPPSAGGKGGAKDSGAAFDSAVNISAAPPQRPPAEAPPKAAVQPWAWKEKDGSLRHPEWLVSVADTGIGIPEGALTRVFERFYREDQSRSRNTGGAGIGLAIAAAIVRAHGGAINAYSDGKGSVFYVTL
jgi:signal transduction histidine kinase